MTHRAHGPSGHPSPSDSARAAEASSHAKELRLHFACPACRKWLSVPLRSAGMTDYCPGCGGSVRIPTLDDEVIGLDLVRDSSHATPATGPAPGLPPPPDEFELAALEIRALCQEIERRSVLALVAVTRDAAANPKPKDMFETTPQYIARLLATIPAAAGRRRQWCTAQLDPLRRRLAGLQSQTFRTHEIDVELGAYHADAQYFPLKTVLASQDGPVTYRQRLKIAPEPARALYANWSRTSKTGTLAIAPGCRRVLRDLRISDTAATQSLELKFDEVLTEAQAAIVAVACSPSGRHVALSTSEGVEIHDLAGTRRVTKLRGTAAQSLSFDPDGKLLAVAATSCTIMNVETGEAVHRLTGVTNAEFSPDGLWLLAGSRAGVSLVSARESELTQAIDDPGGEPLAWCPDGRYFLVQNRLFEVPECHVTGTLAVLKIGPCRFSPDGSRLAVAGGDGEVLLFRVPETTFLLQLAHQRPVRTLAFSPDGETLATGQGTNREASAATPLCLWDTKTGGIVKQINHPGPVSAVEFTPDGAYLLIGTLTGRVRVLHTASLPDSITD